MIVIVPFNVNYTYMLLIHMVKSHVCFEIIFMFKVNIYGGGTIYGGGLFV